MTPLNKLSDAIEALWGVTLEDLVQAKIIAEKEGVTPLSIYLPQFRLLGLPVGMTVGLQGSAPVVMGRDRDGRVYEIEVKKK